MWRFNNWRDWYMFLQAIALDDDPSAKHPGLYGARQMYHVDHVFNDRTPATALERIRADVEGLRTLPAQRRSAVKIYDNIVATLKARQRAILALGKGENDQAEAIRATFGAAILRQAQATGRFVWEDVAKEERGAPGDSPRSPDAVGSVVGAADESVNGALPAFPHRPRVRPAGLSRNALAFLVERARKVRLERAESDRDDLRSEHREEPRESDTFPTD